MGRAGELQSYNQRFHSRGQQINVVAVDASTELGLNYPFNFVGLLFFYERWSIFTILTLKTWHSVGLLFWVTVRSLRSNGEGKAKLSSLRY